MAGANSIHAGQQRSNCKVAKDGRIYIVRDGRWYSTTGIRMK